MLRRISGGGHSQSDEGLGYGYMIPGESQTGRQTRP